MDEPAPRDREPGRTQRKRRGSGREAPPDPAAKSTPATPQRGAAATAEGTSSGPGAHPTLGPPSRRSAVVVGAAILLAFLLYIGRDALSPFVVGLMLVYLLDPPVERLARLGLPRWVSILGVYAVVAIILSQVAGLMIRPLVEQIRAVASDLPGYLKQLDGLYRGLDLPPQVRDSVDRWLSTVSSGGGFDPSVLLPVVNVGAGLLSAILGYIIIPVWAFYLLKDRPQLTAAFDRSLPEEWRADVRNVTGLVTRVFGQWIRGQLFLGLVVGVATFLGLELLGLTIDPVFSRFALLLSIIAGVLELLPIIGPIIAAIPAVLLAATAGVQPAIAAVVLYTLVQQVENNVLVPKIQGDAVELHPSAVMFALVVGGAIGGLLGAILALPITAAGRDVFRYLFRRSSGDDPAAAARVDG
ncbi:MAG TPA: AI-2E family transporter [Candidatus Limnocylindrales bacterium]|nr:AI-2E family transporter [Candidatus Limnocylindrales bacterium]